MAASEWEPVVQSRTVWVVLAVLGSVIVAVVLFAFRPPPQMGADPDVFKTVDALYTAVRMKDTGKLSQCEQRLHGFRNAGKLPKASADYLDGVIEKARAGGWQSAAERLYDFMLAQRRDDAGAKPAAG